MKIKAFLIILFIINLNSCGLAPKKKEFDDAELKPLWKAISEINRDSLGFTQIDRNADISLEYKSSLMKQPYDKMLHIYEKTSRTIAFKKITNNKYIWIGEQEIFTGPEKFETADGIQNEQITITFDKLRISGAPINTLYIQYFGPNKKLSLNQRLELSDVQPFIEKWNK